MNCKKFICHPSQDPQFYVVQSLEMKISSQDC